MRISDWSSDVCSSDLLELAPGEFVIAADQVRAAGDRRIVGRAADLEVGRPFAVKPEPRHHQAVLHLRVDIELPRPGRRFFLLAAAGPVDFLDVELRPRGRRGRPPAAIQALLYRPLPPN